jgi:hypothetical protein
MSLSTNVTDLAQRVGTECKSIRTLLNGNAADLSALTTTAKSSLVAAVNELAAAIATASGIDDSGTSSSSSWSSTKTADEINARLAAGISDLVDGAPTALDTLNELATALGDADSDIAAIVTGLDNRVRVDAAQSFTAPQQAQARTNIGAAAAADLTALSTGVGSTSSDYVSTFTTALA